MAELRDWCDAMIEEHGPSARFVLNHYGYDGGLDFYVKWDDLETDAEFNARKVSIETKILKDNIAQSKKEAKERKIYDQLKVKYG